MGPLVRATEAGKAHTGNLRSRGRRIVIWRTVARAGRGGAEVSTSGPPKRVRALSVVSSLVRLGPKESCTLILVHKAGDKRAVSMWTCHANFRTDVPTETCQGNVSSTA